MAIRFKRRNAEDWHVMVPNKKAIEKGYGLRKGRIMFPTSHDITMNSLEGCLVVLKKLITAGNDILITTKPHPEAITKICEKFHSSKSQIQFRFTITSMNSTLLKYWEPNAPTFLERFNSLNIAFKEGFMTSISIEPFLDFNPIPLVMVLLPYVTETIWIGPMNHVKNGDLKNNYSKENLTKIHVYLKDIPQIRFKDAFMNKMR